MMLYAELIQQPAGEMPHHGFKGRIPRVKGRGERHDDGTSLRNRLHILEMDARELMEHGQMIIPS